MDFVKETTSYKRANALIQNNLYPYFKKIQSLDGSRAQIEDQDVLVFASNSYLGLHAHPRVIDAAGQAIRRYGTSCSGSRFINGTLDIHVQLEEELADFLGKEAVITFGSGFNVNTSVIPAMAGKDDVIFSDELNHASILEGNRIAFAKVYKYKHNDMSDLSKKLRLMNGKKKLIVTDGVFSMDGDIADLPSMIKVSKEYNPIIFVDCAHGIGVLGEKGAGSPAFYKLTNQVQLIGGTFSKSLASQGGFIASTRSVIDYLKHTARSVMFSVSMTPANVAAALQALRIVRSNSGLIEKLWENTRFAIQYFKELGFDIGHSKTPIIPVHIGDSRKAFVVAKALLDKGIFISPIVAPAVPENNARLRFSVTALHTKKEIKYAIETLHSIVKQVYSNTTSSR